MPQRLLLIEDTPAIAKIQKHIAQRLGYITDVAESMSRAIELIEQNQYFCAVVDYVLPDATNGEAIPLTIGADIPTIVMTGKIDDKTRDAVMSYPIIDYITKESRQAYGYLETQLKRLPRNETVRVLIVDDSKQTRNLLKSLLLRHKYRIAQADNGQMALEQLEKFPDIKVIITDNEMPIMNGITLTNKIREKHNSEDKVVIGISGSDDNRISANFLKSGADDYLRKPFYPEEFYCRISQNLDMQEHIAIIRKQANSDYLTDLPNRRYFFESANNKLKKTKTTLMAVMFDIDLFKSINDNYGHDAGDLVLKQFAECLRKFFNKHLIGRLGGEEFAVLFNDEDSEQHLNLIDQFRIEISQKQLICDEQVITYTVSGGYANMLPSNIDQLLKQADENLYQAKENGRNQIVAT